MVDALSRGDIAAAHGYFLSEGEFARVFSWPGDRDPRPAMAARVDASVRAVSEALRGGRFLGLERPAPAPGPLRQGTPLADVTVTRDIAAIDSVTALVDVAGRQVRLRLDGLLQVTNYWRLYSPTMTVG